MRSAAQELQRQGRLAGPLVVNLTLNYAISTVSLASVGHLGTTQLAAAALVIPLFSLGKRLYRVCEQLLAAALIALLVQALLGGLS